ncbi:MAG: glutamate--tRNA ligase [Patescibacteria group bacterium]
MPDAIEKVITRFPPSPTGFLHIGRARTALFNYLFANHYKGSFVFRLEDTDTERSKPEYATDIIESLKWLGISYANKEVWRQSERSSVYKSHLKKLLETGAAYISKETEGERAEVVRFKNPNKTITFTDLVRGEISFDTADLSDFVIAKSPEEPLYHLAVVIDDSEMGVTHILRGEDGISNTPRQILLQEAMGFLRPKYAHIPLILAPDRSKLSGRHGAVSVRDYRDQGYLPEAVINYLALLGWNPGTDQEIFSLRELVEHFDLSKVQKGGAIFNVEKLNWFNKQYIQKLTPAEKIANVQNFISKEQFGVIQQNPGLIDLMMERISTFGELGTAVKVGDYNYFFGKPVYEKNALLWKGVGDFSKVKDRLSAVKELIEKMSSDLFNRVSVKEVLWPYAEKEGRGEVLWPLRMSLSGKEKSPDPFVLSEVLGKKETLERITTALNLL